jgi:predicted O-linked N-acetylglucosamine transferase (SPINDLY family)
MEVINQKYAEFQTQYNSKKFKEAFSCLNEIITGFESLSVKQRLESVSILKNVYYHAAEIIVISVGLNTKRKAFTTNEKMFLSKAIEHLERSINIAPFDSQVLQLYKHVILHVSFYESNPSERLRFLTRSLLAIPSDYVVHYNIGFTYHKLNNLENAVFHYKLAYDIIESEKKRATLQQEKSDEEAHTSDLEGLNQFQIKVLNGLGSLYFSVQNKALSKYYFEMAYGMDENDPDICNQLAVTYTDERLTEKAIYFYEKGIKNSHRAHISNDADLLNASMYMNMGLMYSYECDIEKAIECYNKSLQFKPRFSLAFQNKLLDLNYISHLIDDPMYLYKSHKLINKVYDNIVMDYDESYKVKDLNKDKLNIGFVSGDFVCHPVSYFLSSILDHIDRDKFNVFCYSSKIVKLQSRFENVKYTCVRNTSAEDVKKLIVADNVDILFDLSGHTGDNRVDVFALKPAPITVSYIGYPNTTGLKNMDYRITDNFCDNEHSSKYYVEKLIALKNCFLCYTPGFITKQMSTAEQLTYLPDIPHESEQPFLKNHYITFGCFNRFNKINENVVDSWSKILKRTPNSRLLIKTKEFKSEKLREKFLKMFDDKTLLERIEILPYSDGYTQHLPDYNKIDIALDTFPYSGTTTSCEAMMMGVPVVTLKDEVKHMHSQNVTFSLLKNSDINGFVATSEHDYVDIATSFAKKDKSYFYGFKKTIRSKFCNGKVFNKEEFASDFEKTLSNMYTRHFQ